MACTWFPLQPMSLFVWMNVAKSFACIHERKIIILSAIKYDRFQFHGLDSVESACIEVNMEANEV